ncbi:MAG: hypothetical protein WEC75_08510 [Dehalococcoidia bacterium]
MLFVRLSLMRAKAGQENDVAEIEDDLVAFYRGCQGFVAGYKLKAADEVGDIGRVTVWRSGEDADAAAQTQHVLSRRSELIPLVVEGTDAERSFYAVEGESLAGLLAKLG